MFITILKHHNALGHNGDGSQLYVTGTTYVFFTILRQNNALYLAAIGYL